MCWRYPLVIVTMSHSPGRHSVQERHLSSTSYPVILSMLFICQRPRPLHLATSYPYDPYGLIFLLYFRIPSVLFSIPCLSFSPSPCSHMVSSPSHVTFRAWTYPPPPYVVFFFCGFVYSLCFSPGFLWGFSCFGFGVHAMHWRLSSAHN